MNFSCKRQKFCPRHPHQEADKPPIISALRDTTATPEFQGYLAFTSAHTHTHRDMRTNIITNKKILENNSLAGLLSNQSKRVRDARDALGSTEKYLVRIMTSQPTSLWLFKGRKKSPSLIILSYTTHYLQTSFLLAMSAPS